VTDMRFMFDGASSFNQDLCPWGEFPTFPYENTDGMFARSGCTYQWSFCASYCIVLPYCGSGNVGNGSCSDPNACCSWWGWCGYSVDYCGYSSSYDTDGDNWGDDNLYSNNNESLNEPIANESHQQSVQATALATASISSTSSSEETNKLQKKICWNKGTNKCPIVPGKKPTTAPSCRC